MATKIWAKTVAGAWSDPTKWTPSAPLPNDQIIVGTTTQVGVIALTEDVTTTITSLTLAGNHKSGQTTTLLVTQPAVLTVSGAINLGADSLIRGTGTLVANGLVSGLGSIVASNGGTLAITGAGAIASGVVFGFDPSATAASTLKLDVSGGVTAASAIRLNNAAQALEIGASTTLTIADAVTPQAIAKGTLRLSGGTVRDALGIVVGGNGAAGHIVGFGTVAANVSGGGAKASIDTVTASGGVLDLAGGFTGAAATLIAAIDTLPGSDLKFDGAAVVGQPIDIHSAAQTLEIGAHASLTLTGLELVTNGLILMDGGTLADATGLIVDTGATLAGQGLVTAGTPLSGDGAVIARGGVLELAQDLTSALTTTFSVDSAPGSTLKLDGAVAAATTVGFLGASGILELADVAGGALQGFGGRIAGLNVGASAAAPTNAVNVQATITRAVLAGNAITLFNGAATVGTLTLAATPAAGAYAVARADAALGGTDVFLSNQPPEGPTGLALAPASDSGAKGDRLTNVATPTITGDGVAGDSVTLFDGKAVVGTGVVDGAGHWSITAATLAEGPNSLTATQSDAQGNVSAASAALVVTLDTTPPAVTAALAADTGASASDRVTSNPALGGVAPAGSAVTVSNGATKLGTVTAGADGAWSFTPAGLADGAYALTVAAADAAGNVGQAVLSFTLDRAPPAPPGAPQVTTGAIFGAAAPNSTVTVLDGANVVGVAAADASGAWSLPNALAAGAHALAAVDADPAGNASAASATITAVVGTAGPDTLAGVPGATYLLGGAGDDTYSIGVAGNVVVEAAGGGADTVRTTLPSYTLGANLENLTYVGPVGAIFTGVGNALANTITGASGADVLDGGANASGVDTLVGGFGGDTYIVRNLGDIVVEAGGAGTDTVKAVVNSYTLGLNVENLTFIGAGAFTGAGNGQANVITGGAGADSLSGGGGADTLIGGGGADTLAGGAGADVFVLARGDANGDLITDFTVSGATADLISLTGYAIGSTLAPLPAGPGATTADYAVQTGGVTQDIFHLAGNIALLATDVRFA